jgi:hypothetical protein
MTDESTRPSGLGSSFRLACQARDAGSLHVAADNVSFTIAQRIRLEGEEQFWESVQLLCQIEDNGSLTVQVVIYDPKQEKALQIALVRSRPYDAAANDQLVECDLTPKKVD